QLESRVTDSIQTVVSGGRGLYYTARALADNIATHFVDAAIKIRPQNPWQMTLKGRFINLSDENRRRRGQIEVSRSMFFPDHLRLIYQFTYDDMRFISPDYYSPQSLRMHGIGPLVRLTSGKKLDMGIRYLPAYAKENGSSYEFDHNVET